LPEGLRREVLWLVLVVVTIDAVFVAAYFLARVSQASNGIKLAFTALWTLAVLGIVIRGLTRIRSARLRRLR
jgi:hypothetical protein